ncbi:winged helix-turn-helix domain-containing protein [Pseudomethylobacillus aquaticus]|uniref:winged helix-turn-helix domain-containing protein n=1 Tax=Pseudomethylobacillus aquaticus TaxID=2676064 RepID=UPI003083FB8C
MILKVRLAHGPHTAMGPGKAELLLSIQQLGSISAAAKQLGMSYRRAWELVNTMNLCFKQPVVKTSPGGSHGGGAQVTEFGLKVLTLYQTMLHKAESAAQHELAELAESLTPAP